MARPPSSFRGEAPGQVCGHTWASSLVVDGRLPNGFGKDLTHRLEPVMEQPYEADLGMPDVDQAQLGIGWGGPLESNLSSQLLDRIAAIRARTNESFLGSKQKGAVRWLLDRAKGELDFAQAIHKLWKNRTAGSWSLSFSDRLTNFYAAKNPSDCAGRPGATVEGAGRSGPVRCPTEAEIARRPNARAEIRQRFVDAAHFIRCAEYGLWRMLLYREAKQQWEQRPTGPGGIVAPGGGTMPGDITVGVPVPPQPPDVPVPVAGKLPPPTPPKPPPDVGPEGAKAPSRPMRGETSGGFKWGIGFAVGAVLVVAAVDRYSLKVKRRRAA
jgi:hypothetical protein